MEKRLCGDMSHVQAKDSGHRRNPPHTSVGASGLWEDKFHVCHMVCCWVVATCQNTTFLL